MSAPRKKPAQAALPLEIAEGVHLNLPDQLYFEAAALGSSDFHVLDKDPPSWWYASAHNPARRDQRRRNPALAFGRALHALILEGEQAYAQRFVIQPDPESNRFADTRLQILEALKNAGVPPLPVKDSFDPAKLNVAVRKAGISHMVRQTAVADFEAAKRAGKNIVTEDEDRRLRRMAYQISQHADLGPSLKQGLSEVSVFWRDPKRPDVLLRARFDKLLADFTIDLKTFSNPRDESPEDASINAIVNEGYDIQAEHYRDARVQLTRFVLEGKVWSWSSDDGRLTREFVLPRHKAELDRIAATTNWRWVWIFYQVQSDDAGRERAPIVVPWFTAPEGELFDNARAAIERALDNYATWVGRAGLSQPWADIRPIRSLPVDRVLKRLTYKRTVQ